MDKKPLIGLLICMLMILTTAVPISATMDWKKPSHLLLTGRILYVGGSGPNNYTKIQDAINESFDGDTIFVYNGTYYEHLIVNKTLRILGQELDSTIIDGGGTGSVVTIGANVTINGFTIQHGEAGIMTHSQPDMSYVFTITGNCIKNNKNGIFIGHSQDDVITNNTIMNNEQGIFLFLSSDCLINNNNFINNTNQSFFEYYFFIQQHPRNIWNKNYWDDWHIFLPRPIHGHKELIIFVLRPGAVYTISFPWFNFDWHPAKKPYDIPNFS